MGLDISHDAWSGAYSAFGRWRATICRLAGFPPISLMEGFFEIQNINDGVWGQIPRTYGEGIEDWKPIPWDLNPDKRLIPLLYHSDCDGELSVDELKQIVPALRELLPELKELGEASGHIGNWHDKTLTFIEGAEMAIENNEPLEFH